MRRTAISCLSLLKSKETKLGEAWLYDQPSHLGIQLFFREHIDDTKKGTLLDCAVVSGQDNAKVVSRPARINLNLGKSRTAFVFFTVEYPKRVV